MGKITLGTEIGSAAQFGVKMLSIAERGVKNVLRRFEILEGEPEAPETPPQVVGATEVGDYIMAPLSGIFEPFYELGDEIEAGKAIGQMHSTEEPYREPVPVLARTGGMLMSRQAFPLTHQGDCVATLVRPFKL